MCQPAQVVNQFGRDVARVFGIPAIFNEPGPGGVYLGSVGDQAHSTRRSSHNCASAPGGQESGDYNPDFAHAWDARPANSTVGYEMVRQTLRDPRVRYVLYADHGWYPDGTFEDITDNEQWDLDHDTFHVSFRPGTHNDTRPFFDQEDEVQPKDIKEINRGTAMIVGSAAAQILTAIRTATRILRRAIWKAYGKTKAEIDQLEQDEPIEKAKTAAEIVAEMEADPKVPVEPDGT